MKNTRKILTALVAGAAAGAVVGILFAPMKGKKTRKKIAQEGQKLAHDVVDKIEQGTEKLRGMKDEIQQTLQHAVEEFA
ncbi:MAG: YtxH domain-containing protein [Saprospiraceae bacterium]|nr:YtxH domain-containing protein [Saprospiraceae bacterium]